MKYLFIGEKPSKTAFEKGWTWTSGRLAAKQLFDALRSCKIIPEEQEYVNLWSYWGAVLDINTKNRIIVGMGKIVQNELNLRSISHIPLIHPAARGKIRAKDKYAEHVKEMLEGHT